MYVDDLVEALVLARERGDAGRGVHGLERERVTFGEYFDRIAEIAGARRPRRLPRRRPEARGRGWSRPGPRGAAGRR